MKDSDLPTYMPTFWASGAGGSYVRTVPIASQIGVEDGAASFTDGFPPLTFQPDGSGGVPPYGEDFNGILQACTQWLRWAQAGAPVGYDSSFSAGISGYPKGAILAAAAAAGSYWISTQDDNTSDPDTGGAHWASFTPVQLFGVDSGTANAGVIALLPPVSGMTFLVGKAIVVLKGAAANTGAYTLDVGFGVKAVTNTSGTALSSGQLAANGIFTVVYDGTEFQVQSGGGAAGLNATDLQRQTGNYAVDTGATNTLVVTLSPVPASYTNLVGSPVRVKVGHTTTTGGPTLNVNGLGAKTIVNLDGSALDLGQLPVGGIVEFLYDGTNFQVNVQRGLTYASGNITGWSNSSILTRPHGLGVVPTFASWRLKCLVAEEGYAVGDYIYDIAATTLWYNGTTIGLTIGPAGVVFVSRVDFNDHSCTPTRWAILLDANT